MREITFGKVTPSNYDATISTLQPVQYEVNHLYYKRVPNRRKRLLSYLKFIGAEGYAKNEVPTRDSLWKFYSLGRNLERKLTREGTYYNGKRVGLWTEYSLSGKIKKQAYFFHHYVYEVHLSSTSSKCLFVNGIAKSFNEISKWKEVSLSKSLRDLKEIMIMAKLYILNSEAWKN